MYAYDTIQGRPYKISWLCVDEDYVQTLGMKIRAGRDFSKAFGTDADRAVLVNQAMVKAKGWKQPIGQALPMFGQEKVVGVVEDFHMGSLHEPIQPVIIKLNARTNFTKQLLVRFNTQQVFETKRAIEQTWKTFAPALPLNVSFLSEEYEALYQREHRLRNTVSVFSALAILIGCLGLLGLAAFTAEGRTKEIGIRKILGATAVQLLVLLSGRLCKLIAVALALAIPAAWYLSSRWLEAFAYRIPMTGSVFVAAGAITLTLALLVVGCPALKAARANPAKSLRSE